MIEEYIKDIPTERGYVKLRKEEADHFCRELADARMLLNMWLNSADKWADMYLFHLKYVPIYQETIDFLDITQKVRQDSRKGNEYEYDN